MARKDPAENIDMDLVAEQELSRLQRLYRIMEGDKFAYSGEASGKLKQKKKLIGILKNEQNNLMADYKVATSDMKLKNDAVVYNYLMELLKDYDCATDQVKTEKDHLRELDYQIHKMQNEVAEIKTRTITDAQSQARILTGQRYVIKLENQLEVKIKKFNIVVQENYELRNEIDHLLKERAYFNILWGRLINSLNEGKKFMMDLIEQATIAYDQREEWCNKLAALRSRGNQDLLLHTKDIRYLQRKLDHDTKLQEFLGTKGQKRILADLEMRIEKKRQQNRENMERTLEQYRETLESIKEFCGESDIERLAAKFMKQEEENFALFNYVNELNHESESLSYAIQDLKKNIDAQKELNTKREIQQKENITNLEALLETEQTNATNSVKKLEKFTADLDMVFRGIDNMFKMLKCDDSPILELLGDQSEINQYNVMMYMGLIEKRTTQLLQQVYFKEKTAREKVKKGKIPVGLINPDSKNRYKHNEIQSLVPTTPCPLCVEQELVSDVIDTLQRAQTRKEVAESLDWRLHLPQGIDRVHNVSACHLPQSRKIIQMRYQ